MSANYCGFWGLHTQIPYRGFAPGPHWETSGSPNENFWHPQCLAIEI